MTDKPKILIVDDKPQNLFALEKTLEKLDVAVFKAASGNEALALTLEHDFCMALVDVQMPEMDGYELVELMRGNAVTANLPVIFVSAIYSDEYHHRKGYDSGAVDFLSKPFIPEILMATMSEAFARGMQSSSNPGAFTDADMVEYRKAWAQPGALKSMINWYRAIVQLPSQSPDPLVKVSTLILWGKKDAYLKWEMAEESLKHCQDGQLVFFDDATHWIQHEEPDRVNELLLKFFRSSSA